MESPTTNFTLTSKTSWQAAFWNSKCKKTHTVLLQKIILPAFRSKYLLPTLLPASILIACFQPQYLLPASLPVSGSQVCPQKQPFLRMDTTNFYGSH